MIEQPMPKEQLDDIAWVAQQSPLPIFADESIQRLKDVAGLKGAFTGINIKLMKCTGMREAWKMVTLARALDMKVMEGCLAETSCAITAASQFSPAVDFADLAKTLLLKKKKLLYTVALFVMASACSTKPESKPYNWEDDLYQRLLTDFCMTESQVKDYIRKYIPDVTDEQMRQWEASKALECMMLDGEKRYFRNAGPNLFRVDSTCYDIKIAKEGTSPSGSEKVNMENLPEIISAVKKEGKAIVAPKRMRVTYTLTVDTNAVPAGKIIRCWLPYPRQDQARQQDVKFISASEPQYTFSSPECRHSTLYMEKRAVEGEPTVFSETFEFTANGEWHNLKPEDVQPYDTTTALYKEYTAEREKHIVFSPRLRELAAKLTAGETNPYLKTKRIFRWVNDNFPWASAREYSTIENIPEYVLDNRHGD